VKNLYYLIATPNLQHSGIRIECSGGDFALSVSGLPKIFGVLRELIRLLKLISFLM